MKAGITEILAEFVQDFFKKKCSTRALSQRLILFNVSNTDRYICKIVSEESIARIDFITTTIEKLAMAQINVPQIVSNGEQLYFNTDAKTYFYIYKWIKGKVLNLSNKSPFKLGEILGKFHTEFAKIPCDPKHSYIKVKTEKKSDVIDFIQRYKHVKPYTGLEELLTHKVNLLKEELKILLPDNFSNQIIHGDICAQNIIETSNGIHIIDFDNCCCYSKGYEIIRAAFHFFFDDKHRQACFEEKLLDFILGYQSASYLSIEIKEQMIDLFYLAQLYDDYGLAVNFFEKDRIFFDVSFLKRKLYFIKYLNKNREKLKIIVKQNT